MDYQDFLEKYQNNPDVNESYYNGYTDGNTIYLYYMKPGEKIKTRVITGFGWYFYIKNQDIERNLRIFEKHEKECNLKFEKEPNDWVMVKCERRFPDYKIRRYDNTGDGYKFNFGHMQSNWALQLKKMTQGIGIDPGGYRHTVEYNFHSFIYDLTMSGVKLYEADVDLLRRFIIDSGITIDPVKNCLHFDIETDDTIRGFDNLATKRILSICAEDDFGNTWEYIAKRNDNLSERNVLFEFLNLMNLYPVLNAFNGHFFDYPVLFNRISLYEGITKTGHPKIDFNRWICQDTLVLFKKYYQGSSDVRKSLSLDNLAKTLLKKEKIDVGGTIIDLYNSDKKKLLEYNAMDTSILAELEKKLGYCSLERLLNAECGNFLNEHGPSNKVDMYALKFGKERNIHSPSRIKEDNVKREEKKYEGGYVQEPLSGIHRNLACDDFASLYPNTWCAFNIGNDSYVGRYDDLVEEDKNEIDEDFKKYIITPNGVIFKKYPTTLFSEIFYNLKKSRDYHKAEKKRYEREGNKGLETYHDNYQSIYKILANSCYGVMGLPSSRFYNIEVARSITLSGQYMIKEAIEFAKSRGITVIYADTDSSFISLGKSCKYDNLSSFSKDFNNHIQTVIFPKYNIDPSRTFMELEHEEEYESGIFITKKRYACKKKGEFKDKEKQYKIMGLEFKRSDVLRVVREWQEELIIDLLGEEKDPIYYKRWIRSKNKIILDVIDLDIEEFSISQTAKDPNSYKDTSRNLVHLKIAKILKNRKTFYSGMKVKYLLIEKEPGMKNLNPIPFDDYVDQETTPLDLNHYWNNKIYPAFERVLVAAMPNEDWACYNTEVRRKRKKYIGQYKNKLAIMNKKKNMKMEDFKKWLERLKNNKILLESTKRKIRKELTVAFKAKFC